MSLKLGATNTPDYGYFSEGTGVTPISTTVTLDASGGTEDTAEQTVYLVATTFNYTGITIEPVSEEAGINWQISETSGVGYAESVSPADMDATGADVVKTLYLKAVVDDDDSVTTGNYTAADVNISALENPA